MTENRIQILFEQLKLEDEQKDKLKDLILEKVIVHEKDNSWTFVIKSKNILDLADYLLLSEKSKIAFQNIKKAYILIEPEEINYQLLQSYYHQALTEVKDILIFSNIFQDSLINIDGNYVIEATNQEEERQINSFLPKLNYFLKLYGFDISLTSYLNLEKEESIREEINKDLKMATTNIPVVEQPKETTNTSYQKTNEKPTYRRAPAKEDDPNVIIGRSIQDKPIQMKSIVGETDNITVEGYVFGTDYFESSKTDFKIITLKITDYSDSIYCKVFVRGEDEYHRLSKELKDGKWFIIRGYTKNDQFSKELVLNARDINIIKKDNEEIIDTCLEKRVELHAHTMMSQMDGLVDEVKLIKQAIKWKHKGIAITDHNGCQAFPHVYNTVRDYNKGKEENEKFKAIYGTELTLIDDSVDIIIRGNDNDLLESTYVVFDFETTGFNAGGEDSIIEIGAVKLHNGEIIERFDELINPGKPLSAKITEITNITDQMLIGKDNEENAIKRFIDFYQDLPMVAHNAKFDVSFLEMAYKKYNLGTFKNPVIDTLELSRTLDTNYARHGLSALVKRYDVPWDEDAHHRADYDAEGTALVFHKMLKKLTDRNFNTLNDLNNLVSKEEIHKYGRSYHVNLLALNKTGLKNLFKIISLANTKYLYKTPRILRSEITNHREGILVGSGCYESEVFIQARSKADEELSNIINFYDYVEVQPPECYTHLIQMHDFESEEQLIDNIKKVIRVTKDSGKFIVATGDVHHMTKEDRMYREIIVNQKVPGGGRHPLAKNDITEIPSNHFRTTDEMLENFHFLDEELRNEIVIDNPNKVLDMAEEIEVIIETGGIPFSPKVQSEDGSGYLDCPSVVTNLVYTKAESWYGNPLPYNIEGRIATELYGDVVYRCWLDRIKEENRELSEEELEKEVYKNLHETIIQGFEAVKELLRNYFKEKWDFEKDGECNDESLNKKVKKELGGIIGGGFDPIYLISQRLVKHSNDEGYLVGSRGSVGSSFVATMMGITEVNALPAHYLCKNPECKYSEFLREDGEPYGKEYSSGYDLPNKLCPKCNQPLGKEGQDMPFATFLGFNADKVPDIDLNFSGENQASAHAYTKVLFGEDNVYRAGTIGTVAEKTAFGYVKGYLEDKGITNMRTAEIERLALGCTGVKRTTGQHPGGIVVIPQYMDVFDFTPFQFPADDETSEWRTTHFDYHAIDQDVLKLDILGHDDPTVLRMLQDLSGIDVTTIPLDEPKVLSLLTSPEALGVTEDQILCPTGTLGLPEMGTKFVISMLVETKPKTFSGLVKISGLSHGTDVWAGNASELIANNVCPFDEVIGCRDDIMVNLMNWGMKPIRAFKIMEFVRKGKASKDPETWQGMAEEMRQVNVPEWYIESCRKIKYMFPKAHAVAYVMSALRIAWFKVYKPNLYYASYFSVRESDFDIETMIKGYATIRKKIEDLNEKGYEASNKETNVLECLKIALEATARGIKFGPIDIYKSDSVRFKIDENDENTLIPPFRCIDGLGDTVAKSIVKEREEKEFLSVEDLQKRAKVSQTLIDKMRIMGILSDLPESSQMTLF
ncbi:MAG: PolC-type DNA polymerase III [Firmicutes bacterium]|nr:PolC-type DNA polymerase III [Bacillota bacterium]